MTAQVLDLRRIGCSDLPAILGRDEHVEPVDVWTRIVHGIDVTPPAWVEEAGDWGKRLEEVIAQAGRERFGSLGNLFRPPSITPRARTWQRYSLDRVLGVLEHPWDADQFVQESGESPRILECKARSSYSLASQGWGEDGTAEVDERVLLQVQGQLEAVRADRDSWLGTDVPEVDHVDVLVLVDGQRLRHYPVPYDPELAGMVVQEAERFWRDYVLTQTPPPLEYGEGTRRELARRHPKLGGELPAPEGADAIASELAQIRRDRKALEKRSDELDARLAELAGSAARIRGQGWTWSQWEQDAIGWSALLEDLRARAGLTKAELDAVKKTHSTTSRRSRLTTKGDST